MAFIDCKGIQHRELTEEVDFLHKVFEKNKYVFGNIADVVETVQDLPGYPGVSAADGSVFAVGTEVPYRYYVAINNEWIDLGVFPERGDDGDDGENGFSIYYCQQNGAISSSAIFPLNKIKTIPGRNVQVNDLLISRNGYLYRIKQINPTSVTAEYCLNVMQIQAAYIKDVVYDDGVLTFTKSDDTTIVTEQIPYDYVRNLQRLPNGGTRFWASDETYDDLPPVPTTYIKDAVVVGADNTLTLIKADDTEVYFDPVVRNMDLDGDMSVTYDSEEGALLSYYGTVNGENTAITERLPILPGDGITIDATESDDAIVIKADNVFRCIYGTTEYADVTRAVLNGKICYTIFPAQGGRQYMYQFVDAAAQPFPIRYFHSEDLNNDYWVMVDGHSNWSQTVVPK